MHPLEPPSIVRCRAIAAEMDETAGSRFPCKSARPNLRTVRGFRRDTVAWTAALVTPEVAGSSPVAPALYV